MTAYTPTGGRSKHATLGAGVEDTVLLTANKPWIEVQNQASSGVIYVNVGSNTTNARNFPPAATVAGDSTVAVAPGKSTFFQWPGGDGTALVRLICATANPYAVQSIDG